MSAPEGFNYRKNKDGSVTILHHGKRAATLRREDARDFLEETAGCTLDECQHTMAQLTGNYKRGNARLAQAHSRNRQHA